MESNDSEVMINSRGKDGVLRAKAGIPMNGDRASFFFGSRRRRCGELEEMEESERKEVNEKTRGERMGKERRI